ncbi:hypothetical protein GWI33_015003 [Rhynchophorus ferrugineus]|uniref:Uncharacterized protein n=1 Tax=Rhynchophorus ferrugineus TaxID=354439 RepID=A0A834I3E1_RHYFE|nr:hypothetical protein GWI33_015003 [Rhynchophorus ferrugineus]
MRKENSSGARPSPILTGGRRAPSKRARKRGKTPFTRRRTHLCGRSGGRAAGRKETAERTNVTPGRIFIRKLGEFPFHWTSHNPERKHMVIGKRFVLTGPAAFAVVGH